MITFPNAKINLGLSITEKRPDGYHNLETVFYPVALEDALEIRTSPEADKKFSLHQYGMEISGNPEDNLVVKAYRDPSVQTHSFRCRTGRRLIRRGFHAEITQRTLSAEFIRRSAGNICRNFGSRLRFLYQKRPDLCRRNR